MKAVKVARGVSPIAVADLPFLDDDGKEIAWSISPGAYFRLT